jgi:hypothetical protein
MPKFISECHFDHLWLEFGDVLGPAGAPSHLLQTIYWELTGNSMKLRNSVIEKANAVSCLKRHASFDEWSKEPI